MKRFAIESGSGFGNEVKLLQRKGILQEREQELQEARFICIEAQAGQGKTTLARQIIEQDGSFSIWYQVNERDRDPVSLFLSFVEEMGRSVPGLPLPYLEKARKGDIISLDDIPEGLRLMLAGVQRIVQEKVTVILDDLHILEGSDAALGLVDLLLEEAPSFFRFLLLSRSPVPLQSRQLRHSDRTLYLSDEELALSLAESAELYTHTTGKALAPKVMKKIHEMTEGWVMGVLLAGALPRGGDDDSRMQYHHHLSEFLQDSFAEIFSSYSREQQRWLVLLALFEEVPRDLAVEVTGHSECIHFLSDLMYRNHFVRLRDDAGKTFCFHHLFRSFLRDQSKVLLMEERQSCFFTGAEYWHGKGKFDRAMLLFARGGWLKRLEELLVVHGSKFVAQSRLVSLGQIMELVPESEIQSSPWFSYFMATLDKERDAVAAGKGFECALELFRTKEDLPGELLTLSQLIYYHVLLSGQLAAGIQYLERAAELYEILCEKRNELSVFDRIMAAMNIGTGFLYFSAEMERAKKYLAQAVRLAEKHECSLLATQGRTSLAYCYMLTGWYSPAAELIERSYASLLKNEESIERSLTKYTLEVDFLHIIGDRENFLHHLARMRERIGGAFLSKTIVGPLSLIWEANCEIGIGNLSGASEIIERGLLPGPGVMPPHLESEFLRLHAFLLSFHEDRTEEAVRAADRALQLRKVTGGEQFELFCCFMLGLVYVRCGQSKKGFSLLNRAVTESGQKRLTSVTCCSYFFRSFCYFLTDQDRQGTDDLRLGVKLLRTAGLDYFWGWCPQIMAGLLEKAVGLNIEKSFCQDIAKKRFSIVIRDNGDVIPLMRITLLGNFSLSCGEGSAEASDFTPIQRNLIAMLLASSGLQMNQEIIKGTLWPEATEELKKKSFDTLLSRLRKKLDDSIAPCRAKEYLVLSKGILRLENCRVDAKIFSEFCEKGLGHFSKQEFWQAGNCFYPAMNLWQGCFSKEIFYDDNSSDYCDLLLENLAEIAAKWGDSLKEAGYGREALRVIEKAWKINRTHEGVVRQLYHFYLEENNGVGAKQLLRKYDLALRQEEYSEGDIEELMTRVSSMN